MEKSKLMDLKRKGVIKFNALGSELQVSEWETVLVEHPVKKKKV